MLFFLISSALAFTSALHHAGGSFIRSMDFKHRLRVCNAYPYESALDIVRATEVLTDRPMKYKECRDFSMPLKAGDRLDFKVGSANVGTFLVNELPNNDAVMLLVIRRHDTRSSTASFESHVFANLLNAQITVIDAFKGAAKSAMKIQDRVDAKAVRSEGLRYNSVVAVNPGQYDVVLTENGRIKSASPLVAVNREAYVVLRVGVESEQGKAYPQEIVVFPQSDKSLLASAPCLSALPLLAFLALNM
eukprot:GEMP01063894.1.p1 GENE.GEMP01063894.1~~GEMP01063894.1.p1  ORF type:complete len:276 (+),score=39.74 GEMP01063894.1:89-829(+)